MNSYYVDNVANRDDYCIFIKYMLEHSEAFSIVQFKYKSDEMITESTRKVIEMLHPFMMSCNDVTAWPGTITANENNHIYKLIMYRSDYSAQSALLMIDNLYEWDYPAFPMDLCFFRNGYAWFASSAHEQWNALYTDDNKIVDELSELGLAITFEQDIDDSVLFYDTKSR